MVDATTSNILLTVPARGADPGTWDVPVNGNSNAIDGFVGGVATISLSNANISLTAPSGTVTATGGPFQSQNRIIKFTGALTSNVQVTLPLPGQYTIQNLTTGFFVVTFVAVGAGKIVATPQGSIMQIWNDGTDVWLVKNQIPGALTFLGGAIAVPSWIAACSLPPFLLCDGSIYTASIYPALASIYGATFGGNGTTSFGVEDLQGRVPLAYDGTGTRITIAGCGINGQTLGASQDKQTNVLLTANLPPYTPAGTNSTSTSTINNIITANNILSSNAAGGANIQLQSPVNLSAITVAAQIFTGTPATGQISTPVNNVQPAQVVGIWLVAT